MSEVNAGSNILPKCRHISSIILTHDHQYWILLVASVFSCQCLLGQSILLRNNRLWESSFSGTKICLCLISLHCSELCSLWNGPDETYSFWIAALSETGDWYYLPVNVLFARWWRAGALKPNRVGSESCIQNTITFDFG